MPFRGSEPPGVYLPVPSSWFQGPLLACTILARHSGLEKGNSSDFAEARQKRFPLNKDMFCLLPCHLLTSTSAKELGYGVAL